MPPRIPFLLELSAPLPAWPAPRPPDSAGMIHTRFSAVVSGGQYEKYCGDAYYVGIFSHMYTSCLYAII